MSFLNLSTDSYRGAGRCGTDDNVNLVEELALSQENATETQINVRHLNVLNIWTFL